MDIYKQGLQEGLRFQTTKGLLSIEQLFQLRKSELATAVKNQKKILNKGSEDDLAFLDEQSTVDKTEQLKFDILKDVYLTKKEELNLEKKEKEDKEHNQKIMGLIQEKKEGQLKEMSIEDLEKLLK